MSTFVDRLTDDDDSCRVTDEFLSEFDFTKEVSNNLLIIFFTIAAGVLLTVMAFFVLSRTARAFLFFFFFFFLVSHSFFSFVFARTPTLFAFLSAPLSVFVCIWNLPLLSTCLLQLVVPISLANVRTALALWLCSR